MFNGKDNWPHSEKELIRILYQSRNHGSIQQLLKAVSSQRLFLEIAKNAPYPPTRAEAVLRINEDFSEELEAITITDSNYVVKREALEKINNQSSLFKIVKLCNDINIKRLALQRLSDKKYIHLIIKEEKNYKIRRQAVRKIHRTNQKYLFEIFMSDSNYYVREEALFRLISNEFLSKIVLDSSDTILAEAAIHKITDVNILLFLRISAKNHFQKSISEQLRHLSYTH